MTNNNTTTNRTVHHAGRRALLAGLAGVITLASAGGAYADGRHGRPPAEPPMTISAAPTTTTAPPLAAPPSDTAPRPAGPTTLAGQLPSGFTLSATAKAHGTWARISYATNATSLSIRISDHQPVFKNGVWSEPYMDSIIGPEIVEPYKTKMYYDAMSLLPGTTYYFIVTVPTAVNQLPVQAVGTFTTLTRTLTISFDTIHVTDDSDKGAKGAGDFTFWFNINGTQVATVSKDISSDSSWAISMDGKPVTVTIPNVLNNDVPFGVQVFEDDIQSWDTCGHFLLPGDTWDGVAVDQENECGTWLAMTDEYSAAPGQWKVGYGHQENTPIEFTMSPWKSSVHLTISGTITAVWA
jgi:hypothetical protein